MRRSNSTNQPHNSMPVTSPHLDQSSVPLVELFKDPFFPETNVDLFYLRDPDHMATVSTIPKSDWRYQTAPTNLPPLLTIFTPPGECSTRWIYDDTSSSAIYSGRAVFQYYTDAVADSYYYECNPYRQEQTTPLYSPGVCGDSQQPVEIDEIRLDYVYWLAYCCPRYATHALKGSLTLTPRTRAYTNAN